ncbi:MAG: type II toxin-antitoxin system RelE/ParE family toxin [Candidatus Paceibacterota bacterium]
MKKILYDSEIEKFLSSLQKPAIAKVIQTMALLEEFGERLTMPHSKKIQKNLFELRVGGSQKVRIFYTFHKNGIFLLHGFVKKTSKIPKKEMDVTLRKLKQFDMI